MRRVSMIPIDILIKEGFLESVYGAHGPHPSLALPIWARSQPKALFKAFVRLASTVGGTPLHVLVDDVWTQIFTERSNDEQKDMNRLYSNFFNELGCNVRFSSDFLPTSLELMRTVGSELSLQEIRRVLPREKRENFEMQDYRELTHVVVELAVLRYASECADAIVMGSFSQGMASLYRSTTTNPLPILITPKFEGELHAREYCRKLVNLEREQREH
jgi:hypothetical protein